LSWSRNCCTNANFRFQNDILRNLCQIHGLPSDTFCANALPVCLKPHTKRSQKMRFGKVSLAAAAAVALAGSPVLAQVAAPAKPVAAKVQRAGAAKEESKLGGGSGIIVAVVAAAAVIAGIVIAAGNDDDAPTSP
jgi:hypothetical protein